MKPRIYTDTSVLGGCEDDEFREPSRRLVEAYGRGEFTLVLSELTVRELEGAPDSVRAVLGTVPDEHLEALALSQGAEDLASAYTTDGVIGPRMHADALHIALATVARVDRPRELELQARREAEANPRVQWGQPQQRLPASRDTNASGGTR